MKLKKIAEKYSKKAHNGNNYDIGGGLSTNQFASNRHEDAKYDDGKLTFGKACQMFKKATGINDLDFIKEIIHYAVPNMEWHHAGCLPKSYGGGMKKTYFLNSAEIVDLADNWKNYINQLEISKKKKRIELEDEKNEDKIKEEFLQKHAKKVIRIITKPCHFYETNREMSGKYGWFCSYEKSYNLPEYYTGWEFLNEKSYNEFYKI